MTGINAVVTVGVMHTDGTATTTCWVLPPDAVRALAEHLTAEYGTPAMNRLNTRPQILEALAADRGIVFTT